MSGRTKKTSDLKYNLKQIAFHKLQVDYTNTLERKGLLYVLINPKINIFPLFKKI